MIDMLPGRDGSGTDGKSEFPMGYKGLINDEYSKRSECKRSECKVRVQGQSARGQSARGQSARGARGQSACTISKVCISSQI